MDDGCGGSRGERELQEQLGTTERAERFRSQAVLDHLNPEMRDFVSAQDMVFVATADADGECDSSVRAGPPGFVAVLDAVTLAYPEYRGNGVMASLGNIRETGQVGLLFLDLTRSRIGLHVNGRARVVVPGDPDPVAAALPVDPHPGRQPVVWVVVEVQEAYVHCRKHLPRLVALPEQRAWGTDDPARKGGDPFRVAARRAEAPAQG